MSRAERGGGIVGGLTLVGIGTWFLMDRLGVDLPRFWRLWPAVPLLAGLSLLLTWIMGRREDPDRLFTGVGGTLLGLFFFMFTLGPLRWGDMADFWPVFPLIAGLAFLARWGGGGRRERGLLVPAGLGLAVGILGLTATLGGLSFAWMRGWMRQGWPVALILVGLWMIFGQLLSRRRRN